MQNQEQREREVDHQEKVFPKIEKLTKGGDIYAWMEDLQIHFETLGLWNRVSTQQLLPLTPEQRKEEFRCKRDILYTLDPEIRVGVRRIKTAYKMYERVQKMFLGSSGNKKMMLRDQINDMKYSKDVFKFMSKYQAAVVHLDSLDGIHSHKEVTQQFLRKLPGSLAPCTHQLKKDAAEAIDGPLGDYV